MRIIPPTFRTVVMPTGLRNQGVSPSQGVWLGGCENCNASSLALAAYIESSSEPTTLFEHWNAHDPALCMAIAQEYRVTPEQVFITSGAYGALETLAFLCFRHGIKVATRIPDWPGFSHFIDLGQALELPVRADQFPFQMPVDDLISHMNNSEADACLIANPSATQGFEYTAEEVTQLIRSNPERLVIVDEADSILPEKSTAFLTAKYENYIAIGSFSKLHGLSGQRIGWLVVPPLWIPSVRQVIGPCTVSSTAVACAIAAIQDKEHLADTKERVAESLGIVMKACESSPYQAVGYPGCFACFLSPRSKDSPDPYSYLGTQGIWLNPSSTFGLGKGIGGRLNLSDPIKVRLAAEAITRLR